MSASKRVEPLCSIFADVSVRSGLSYLGVEDGGGLESGNMRQSQDTGDFKFQRKDAEVCFHLTAFSQSLQIF